LTSFPASISLKVDNADPALDQAAEILDPLRFQGQQIHDRPRTKA